MSSPNIKDFEELHYFLKDIEFSGNILVKKNNSIIFQKSYGFANREFNSEINFSTKFALASITKMFTGIGILQLVQSGKIHLSDSIFNFLDYEFLDNSNEIAIKDLLTHSSGIPDYIDENEPSTWGLIQNSQISSIDDYIESFKKKSYITSQKGTFHYNNFGYILLGKIIENVIGGSYYDIIQKDIFNKIEMNNSGFFLLDDVIENRAEGYDKQKDDSWRRNVYKVPRRGASDGGAYSTIADLVNFIQAILKNRLLSLDHTKLFLEPVIFDYHEDDLVWKYGLGNWFLLNEKSDKIIRWGHPGEDIGVSNRLFYYPDTRCTVIILSNNTNSAGPVSGVIHKLII